MPQLRRFLLIWALCAPTNIQCTPKSVSEAEASTDSKQESRLSSSKAENVRTLGLSHLQVVDNADASMQTPESRSTVEEVFFRDGAFQRKPESNGCRAEIGVFYAVSSNGKLVKTAEAGTALVGIEAMVHCPRGKNYETFRVELKDSREFKVRSAQELRPVFESLLQRVATDATDQLVGQITVRPLPNGDIIRILRERQGEGKLMEAAIEAGERRLNEAIPELLGLTRHETEVVRLRAAAALGLLKVRRHDIIRALARLTEGSRREQIVVAVAALSDIGGSQAQRYLDNIAVSHPDEVVRALARAGAEKVKNLAAEEERSSPRPD